MNLRWQLSPTDDLPEEFQRAVQQYTAGTGGRYTAQLLWQRGLHSVAQLPGFLHSDRYTPTSPFAFGEDMHRAIARLQQAYRQGEAIAIWGDFDADGITATAVLWEGLGEFFPQYQQLFYYIPNRFTESHGLSSQGIQKLAAQGCRLIVTCDTGSTHAAEIAQAQALGIDVIVTDHHTLPPQRPPVVALINSRTLPVDHPLAHLSGVAVAYKLVEALYEALPDVPQRPLEQLLDLVAIGLIADLVELKGDGRYLAQQGIVCLQQNQDLATAPRPGIAKLLEFCKRNGDRPTDISFGLGPRINAISRIQGDASFAVELLTSRDRDRCVHLAEATELANTRRKSLQREVIQQVRAKLASLDLSTTSVIVLADSQWSVGILGLVAGQIAQEYNRPTILLSTDTTVDATNDSSESPILARGSARSVSQIDLYQLLSQHRHLLYRWGGHPFAAGLSLPVENVSLFAEAINRQWREQIALNGSDRNGTLQIDLVVTVAELGKDLFRELKWLEPYSIGNPVPKLLIQNCWFEKAHNQNIKDWKGRKIRYIKTEFELWDESTSVGFPGIWWEHYRDELPQGRCDAIVELDFNAYQKRYEVRLVAVQTQQPSLTDIHPSTTVQILDWRQGAIANSDLSQDQILPILTCPSSWDELRHWVQKAYAEQKHLAIAYADPVPIAPAHIWQTLVGIAKYLNHTHQSVSLAQLLDKLGISDRTLQIGLNALESLGFDIQTSAQELQIFWPDDDAIVSSDQSNQATQLFWSAIQEEQFRRHYFYTVSVSTIQTVAQSAIT